jgi:hypothetical protein
MPACCLRLPHHQRQTLTAHRGKLLPPAHCGKHLPLTRPLLPLLYTRRSSCHVRMLASSTSEPGPADGSAAPWQVTGSTAARAIGQCSNSPFMTAGGREAGSRHGMSAGRPRLTGTSPTRAICARIMGRRAAARQSLGRRERRMMRERLLSAAVVALVTCGIYQPACPATAARDLDAAGTPIRPGKADPAISKALSRICAREIEHTIRSLVAFHTRFSRLGQPRVQSGTDRRHADPRG